jgi:hypothetical protein
LPVAVTRPVVETEAIDPLEVAHETGTSRHGLAGLVAYDRGDADRITQGAERHVRDRKLDRCSARGSWFAVGLSEQAESTTTTKKTIGEA